MGRGRADAAGDGAQEADAAAIRQEVRAWIGANWDSGLTLREWWARLAEAGWAYPTWPRGWFGRDLAPDLAVVVLEELRAAGVVLPPHGVGQTMGAPVVLQFGTDEQKRRFLRPVATGEESWCQFFSEPNAGSDLAGVQTRAVRDGDEWIVNGQKVWNGGALTADRGVLVARTDVDVPKHRGLSFFVIDVDQPGVEIRPIRQLNGAAEFNESFFTDARVPDANLIGGANNGWAVALATLAVERSSYAAGSDYGAGVSGGRKAGMLDLRVGEVLERSARAPEGPPDFPLGSVPHMVDLAREMGCDGDPRIRQRIAQLHCLSETARLTSLRARAAAAAGKPSGPESSLGYLAGVLIARASRDLGLAILGAAGMLQGEGAPHHGAVQHMALTSLAHGIQGGTEQIQRNVLGERVLGLPKEPQVDRDLPFKDVVGLHRR